MELLKGLEGFTGIINLIIMVGIIPIVKMSHQVTAISTKLELWEETLKNCKTRRSSDTAQNCQH